MTLYIGSSCAAQSRRVLVATALFGVMFAALAPGCAKKAPDRAGGRGDAAPVLVGTSSLRDVPLTLRTIGTVEAYSTVDVCARVSGQLQRIHFREGQDVREGDPLFTIDSAPYRAAFAAAQANLARDRARLATVQADAQRFARLVEKEYVTRQQSEQADAEARADSAVVRATEAALDASRLDLEYCAIRAPISGRTGNVLLHQGNLVRANDPNPLVVINQVSPIFASFSIPEKQLPRIVAAMKEHPEGLAVTAQPSGAAGAPATGRLTFLDNAVDAATGTVLLKAEFPNEDRTLWPGEFVQVQVVLGERTGAVVVPAGAVQTSQKGDYVFVIKPDQTAEMRPVTSGPRINGDVIVEKGLEAGETVVTDGQLRVVPGGKVTVKPSVDAGAGPGNRPAGGARQTPAGGSSK